MTNLKKLYFWASFFPAAVILIMTLFILVFFRFLPAKLPLFYSLPWGERQLADHLQFMILPAILAVITLLNVAISSHLHQQQSFFKKVLIGTTILSTVILIITFIKIVFLFT